MQGDEKGRCGGDLSTWVDELWEVRAPDFGLSRRSSSSVCVLISCGTVVCCCVLIRRVRVCGCGGGGSGRGVCCSASRREPLGERRSGIVCIVVVVVCCCKGGQRGRLSRGIIAGGSSRSSARTSARRWLRHVALSSSVIGLRGRDVRVALFQLLRRLADGPRERLRLTAVAVLVIVETRLLGARIGAFTPRAPRHVCAHAYRPPFSLLRMP